MYTITSLILTALVSLLPSQVYAQHSHDKTAPASKASELTKEQRAKMAEMHTQAAECLKSDKSAEDCHKQMMDNCPMAHSGSCPMTGMHKTKAKK